VLFATGEQLAEQSLRLCADQPVSQLIEQRDNPGLRRIGLVAQARTLALGFWPILLRSS
jgi:hypothetical protein